jgi:crotonobetainyl-CoA:carnitine CoA-transferase CaiB-like acyl-CoA transferase
MLSPYRVLDLTDERGQLAGLLLAQLGADVIAVEPADGAGSRSIGPFVDDVRGPERSLVHAAYNRGKRSVRVDAVDLDALAATADVVLDSRAMGVDLGALREANPGLVTVTISAFGETGPKADWLASDLTVAAASGQLVLTGDDDRAPVRISEPQSYHHAALEAAIAALVALSARERTGVGQHVDVSAQQAFMQATQSVMLTAAIGAPAIERRAGGVRLGSYNLRFVYPAKDGHVSVTFLFGDMIGRFTQRLMQWVWEEGHCSEEIRDLDYVSFFELFRTGRLPPSTLTEATDAVAALTATRTKQELFLAARDRRLLISPVATAADLLANEHLAVRGYWDELTVGEQEPVRTVRVPGPWAVAPAAPLRRLGPAPRLGEHDCDIDDMLCRPGPSLRPGEPIGRALEGLRVLDLTWVIAGPMGTRLLADHGATVVRIESERRVDVIRASGPFLPDRGGIEDTALWHLIGAGKHSVALDLSSERGRDVVRDLARWADVVTESFTPGAMDALGLGFDTLRADNPDLVMVSSSLMGQHGPLAQFAGFGNLAASIAGFTEITGWPDRDPAGPFMAYTDYVSPRFLALATLAGVAHARRTGRGQHIDLSQVEASVQLLAPALLDHAVNGRDVSRTGNDDRHFAPHGVYAAGDPASDEWIAIACTDDAQWTRLSELIDRVDLAGLSVDERLARRRELDAILEAWTTGRDPDELQYVLQRHRVCAHKVQRSTDCVDDPQLQHREHFRRVPHPIHGEVVVEGPPTRFSINAPRPAWGGPTLGQHTMFVLEELLGYDDDVITELVVTDVLR